jgi:hypothetical protein
MTDAAGFTTRDVPLPDPDRGVLRLHRRAAPALPLDLFGTFWSGWLADAAEGASAPPDFVVAALLPAASALIGNARHVSAWQGWCEPPVLWCASVGDPSSGKSPAADPVMRILAAIEAESATGFPDTRRQWETRREAARACKARWQGEVKEAAKIGTPPPPMPADADEPPEPQRPRVRANDATVEKLALLLSGNPKGLLFCRDELAGWVGSFERYSAASDRAFWLEAYGGRAFTVDRVKHPEPIAVPHLSVAVFGSIQPERLSAIMQDSPDDGLLPRFLFAWPERLPYTRPTRCADHNEGLAALRRLATLRLGAGPDATPCPVVVPFAPDAVEAMHRLRGELREREAAGLLAGSVGKAPGHVLRLSLVLEYLWWCDGDGPEPDCVSARAVTAAAALVCDYFLPMAERTFGDAGATMEERNAATLARWIQRQRRETVNVRQVRDHARLPGLREAQPIHAAAARLVEAGWLFEPARDGSTGGRPRSDYPVNPRLWDAPA